MALVTTVFLAETLIMLVLGYFVVLQQWQAVLIDVSLLSAITATAVYHFAFTPLSRQLAASEKARDEARSSAEELARASLAMSESQQRYLHLFENAPVGYLVVAEDGKVMEINQTAALLFGISKHRAVCCNIEAFLTSDEHDRWQLQLQKTLKIKRRKTIKLVLKRDDGSTFYGLLDCICETTAQAPKIHIAFTDISKENFTVFQELAD